MKGRDRCSDLFSPRGPPAAAAFELGGRGYIVKGLWPVLHAKHLHLVFDDFVHGNVGPGREHKLSGVIG